MSAHNIVLMITYCFHLIAIRIKFRFMLSLFQELYLQRFDFYAILSSLNLLGEKFDFSCPVFPSSVFFPSACVVVQLY